MIDKRLFEDLPFRDSNKGKDRDGWYSKRQCENHDTYGTSPYKKIERILYSNIGKSFALAFRYYCKQVPRYQQHLFLREFYKDKSRWSAYRDYYLDKQGNIQKVKQKNKYKGPFKIYSDDYKVIWKHKKFRLFDTDKRPYRTDEYTETYVGTITLVDSRKDPRWIAYKKKKYLAHKALIKSWKEDSKNKSLEIFNRSIQAQKEELRKARELDILKRNQAGFDETSFKGLNYHGRKNKLCKQQKKLSKSLRD